MSEVTVGILGICLLMAMFLTGIELAYGMTMIGFIGIGYLGRFSAASNQVVKDFFDTFTSYGFTVIPIFVLMGKVASNSDIAEKALQFSQRMRRPHPRRHSDDHRRGGNSFQSHVRFDTRHLRHLCRYRNPRDDTARV